MDNGIEEYVEGYSKEIQDLFAEIRKLVIKSTPYEIDTKLWAKLPSFYVGDKFVRIIPFKDHINIEAAAITRYKPQLEQYKITPKGMLQIYLDQDIPCVILESIFIESLT